MAALPRTMSSAKSSDSAKDAAAAVPQTECETLRRQAIACKAALNVHGSRLNKTKNESGDYEMECAEVFMKYRLCMKAWRAAESEKRSKGIYY